MSKNLNKKKEARKAIRHAGLKSAITGGTAGLILGGGKLGALRGALVSGTAGATVESIAQRLKRRKAKKITSK